ncbi:MAG: hypothetical protein ABSB32_22600 [Thermodesulfobacteriota bacterium]
MSPQAKIFPPGFPDDAVLVVVDYKPQPYFQDIQHLEAAEKIGARKDIEETKHKLERLGEEPMQHYRESQKAERVRIIQKYKEINSPHSN